MSDAQSSRGGSAAPTLTESRVRERVTVRRRRRRKARPTALDAERWLTTGGQYRRLRMFTLGAGVLVSLVITLYFLLRR